MLNKIVRLLFGKNGGEKQAEKNSAPKKSGKVAVDEFLSSIKGIGHPEYQILDKQYSPSSRVPCTDLVPFISEQIEKKETDNIKAIMRAVIEGNPGLGIGSSWIDKSIEQVLSKPYEEYVKYINPSGLNELKALFIVASKDGGNSEFLITDEIPRLISWACICHQPIWSEKLQHLASKANKWTSTMAEETSYWENYEQYDAQEISTKQIDKNLIEILSQLTPSARLQLCFAIEKGGGSLDSLTNYRIRNFGINIIKTNSELVNSKLLIPSYSKKVIEKSHSKKELIELCETYQADYKKSWIKEKLVNALQEVNGECLETISKIKNLVEPNYQLYPNLKDIVVIADTHRKSYELLCFA